MSRHSESPRQTIGNVTVGDDAVAYIGTFNGLGQQNSQQALFFREMDHRPGVIVDACPGTCGWILENPTLKDWENAQRGLLWVKGKPGTGKSTIMKYMWSHYLKIGPASQVTASFFCHGEGADLQKSSIGLLRALLHLILKVVPQLNIAFENEFQARCKNQGPYDSAWDWTESELKSFLQDAVLRSCGERALLILVDAVDECGDDSARNLLEFFHNLVIASQTQPSSRLKICVSSRHYPLVRSDGQYEVVVDGENLADIRTYAAQKLDLFRRSTPRYDELLSSIALRAGEIFQWCVLVVPGVVRSLESKRPVELILQDIQETPRELFKLYRQIVRSYMDSTNVDSRGEKQFRELFQWVALAKRPLSAHELRSALLIDDFNQHTGYHHVDDSFGTDIEYLSCGLAKVVRISDGSDSPYAVGFIHHSVQEYFVNGGGLQDLRQSGSEIATTRMAELEIVRSSYRSVLLSEPPVDALTQHPLLEYALSHMFDHARSAEEGQSVQNDLVRILGFPEDDCVAKLAQFEHITGSKPYMLSQTLLHVAAYFDIPNLISCVLNLAPDMSINIRAPSKKTALHIAAEHGSCNAIDRLLDISQTSTIKPMLLRCSRGSRRPKLNTRDLDQSTPLMLAARNGHSKIVARLAQTRRADLDKVDLKRKSAVYWAVWKGHLDTVKVLLHHGADFRTKGEFGLMPLSLALMCITWGFSQPMIERSFALFWLILDQARQDLYLAQSWTLWWPTVALDDIQSPLRVGLSSRNSLEFAQGLLDRGFDPHAPDRHGNVWFLYLDSRSKPGTVDLLQTLPGANINFKDKHGRTLLARLAGSRRSDCLMIKHLLETPGVDAYTRDKHGKTPLMIAAREGRIEVLKVLLANVRSDPQARDKNNLCALDHARERRIDVENNFTYSEDRNFPPISEYKAKEEADAIIALLESSCTDCSLAPHLTSAATRRARARVGRNVKKIMHFCCDW